MDIRLAVGGEQAGLLPLQRLEVQLSSGDEVLGLANIHPEALEVKRMELAILNHSGEGLLLDGGGAQLDALEDGGAENVDTGVDSVANKLDGLLDEPVNARLVAGGMHNDTVLGGLLDLCDADGALISMLLVECGQLLERVFAGHVGVEDEERRVVLAEDVSSKLEGASSAQRLGLD